MSGERADNPAFDTFWILHSKEFKLELKIPEVVIGELKFQQATSALKAMNNASENLTHVNVVCNKNYNHKVTELKIKRSINRKIKSWVKENNISVIQTPLKNINEGFLKSS